MTSPTSPWNDGDAEATANGTAKPGRGAPADIAGAMASAAAASNAVAAQEIQPGGVITPSKIAGGPTESTPTLNGNSPAQTATPASSVSDASMAKRLDVDSVMIEFQKLLGAKWDRYRDVITQFLMGRLTRFELQDELDDILDKNTVKYHNHFLLANLANSLRDPPPGDHGALSGWFKKHKDSSHSVRADSQLAKLKEDILSLSVRERKRIKAIARESGKRAPIPSTVTATRQSMLPKIPFVNDKDKQKAALSRQPQGSMANGSASAGSRTRSSQSPGPSGPTATGHAHTSNPMSWTHDIIHAYDTPLASETYEFPDNESLISRMLGISLEHGLLQGVELATADIIMTGLENYLKDVVEQMFDRVKARKTGRGAEVVTAEDMALVVDSAPHYFVEMNGPTYRLKNVILQDEETAIPGGPAPQEADEFPEGTSPGLAKLLRDITSSS